MHVAYALPRSPRIQQRATCRLWTPKRRARFSCSHALRVCAARSSIADTKHQLRGNLQAVNRGIFGVKAPVLRGIDSAIEALEVRNPTGSPLGDGSAIAGTWRVLYSSIRILGTKRSRLGLREFVRVGDLWQDIDWDSGRATNRVEFSVAGLPGNFGGELVIEATFEAESERRAAVQFESAELRPEQLNRLFGKHLGLLLEIFNPDGWLDVTFLDEDMRVGRDHAGNVFVLERASTACP